MDELKLYDPVSNVERTIQTHLSGNPQEFYKDYHIEPSAVDTPRTAPSLSSGVQSTPKGPLRKPEGPSFTGHPSQCKEMLFKELDSRPVLTHYLEAQVKPKKQKTEPYAAQRAGVGDAVTEGASTKGVLAEGAPSAGALTEGAVKTEPGAAHGAGGGDAVTDGASSAGAR